MLCPVCRVEMIILEHKDVEVDHCVDCGGTWLDAGEIDLLLGEETAGRIAEGSQDADRGEAARPCPVCARPMAKRLLGEVLYDSCEADCGLWFDRGEVAAASRTAGADLPVAQFIGEVFGDGAGAAPHGGG